MAEPEAQGNIFTGVFSGNMLKLAACLFMLVDHIGMILFPAVVILRIVGRLAMPLFAFTFAEGCYYTRHKWRHFALVLAVGIAVSAGMTVAYGRLTGDIMITLFLSCLLIYALEWLKRAAFAHRAGETALAGAALAALLAFDVWLCFFSGADIDYGLPGVLLPVTVHLLDFRSYGVREGVLSRIYTPAAAFFPFAAGLLALSLLFGSIQVYSLLALLPIYMYSGRRGEKRLKYFFYIFYPAHLAVLAGIWLLLHPGFFAGLLG